MLKKEEDLKSKRIKKKPKKPNGFEKKPTKPKKADKDNEDEEAADNHNDIEDDLLSKEKQEEKLQQRFIECLNSFNTNAINECISYLDNLPYEVIENVLSKTSGIQFPNWNYAKAILDDYVKRKIDSMEKIEKEKEAGKSKLPNKASALEEWLNE